jgi:hypothetical protein
MRVKLTIATIALVVITTGLLAPSTAGAAQTSTQVAMTCTTDFGPPITGQFTVSMSAPDSVAPGATSTVQFDIAVGEFFGIPAPFDGTIDSQFGFSASNATPAGFTLAPPSTHFNAGDFMSTVSLDQQLTATGPSGSVISVQFLSFAYTIVPDLGGSLSVSCEPDAATVVGAIPIALLTSPPSKADCKQGGWQDLTDASGVSFSNQGQCVRTTVGAPKT